MPWDTVWLFIQSQAPSLEVVGTFIALGAAILLMPRLAGIKWSYRIMVRDLSLLAFFAVLSLYLIGQEPEHHWMQRLSDWLDTFF